MSKPTDTNASSPEPRSNDPEAIHENRDRANKELDKVLGELRSLLSDVSETLDTPENDVTPTLRAASPMQKSEPAAVTPVAAEGELKPSDESGSTRFAQQVRVDAPKRRRFWKNFQTQHRESTLERALFENAYANSLRGKLVTSRATSWLFDPSSRKLDLVTLTSALAVGIIVAWSLSFSSSEAESANATPVEPAVPSPSNGEDLLLAKEHSEEVIRDFFAADSVETISAMIRHPDIVRPLMAQWYANRPPVPVTQLEFGESRVKQFGDSRYCLVSVLLPDEADPRPVAVEDTPQGFKVDWETAVGYQSMDWESLRQEKPTAKVYMRVVATNDDYHNYQFMDTEVWVCRRLSHPNADSVLYGYTRRLSKVDQALSEAFTTNISSAEYFILGLRYPENPQADNLVYIDEVLQSKWVIDYQDGQTHFDL